MLWHGPYRVTEIRGQDVSINKVYFPQEGIIQVHQLRVQLNTTGMGQRVQEQDIPPNGLGICLSIVLGQ